MEDVCLDRMNAFVKSNIRLYLGMSGWHRLLHFVREQTLISSKKKIKKNKNPHFVSEAMQRNGGNRLVIAAERSSGSCLAQVLSALVPCRGGLFACWHQGWLSPAEAVFGTLVGQTCEIRHIYGTVGNECSQKFP